MNLKYALWILDKLVNLSRTRKQAIVFGIDCLLLVLSTLVAYSLRVGYWSLWSEPIRLLMIGAALLFVPIFYFSGVYRAIFRYAGVGMMQTLVRAFAAYTALVFLIYMVIGMPPVPRTMGLLQPTVFFIFVAAARISARYLIIDVLGRGSFSGQVRRVVVYGAGEAGQQLASSIRFDPHMRMTCFVDDDTRLAGQRLDGFMVYGRDRLEEAVNTHRATDILLAMPGTTRRRRREILESLQGFELDVKTLPQMRELVSGRVSLNDIRPVEIEDLLGREAVTPNELLLGRTVVGKCVLVTGAGGSIGSELCRQIVEIGARRIILFEHSEYALYSIEQELNSLDKPGLEIVPVLASVLDEARLEDVFSSYQVDTVFHAAAYKHVPLVELNSIEGARNNVLGTRRAVEFATRFNVADFILISTDKAVRPTNVMGATKRAAELIVQAYAAEKSGTRFSMVRFGNVLGSSGSVVPLFRQQIEAGGPITLTDRRITRYFMTIPEAASLVIQAAGMAKGGEVFVLDMGKPMRIIDLARTMVQLVGLTVRDEARPDGDISIKEVGLRPGEKLYEELLIGEDPQATKHPQIMMAHESFRDLPELKAMLDRFEKVDDATSVISLLQSLVPEFDHRRDNMADEESA